MGITSCRLITVTKNYHADDAARNRYPVGRRTAVEQTRPATLHNSVRDEGQEALLYPAERVPMSSVRLATVWSGLVK
jgi:hypothetical protein